jgi:hypothetical protein
MATQELTLKEAQTLVTLRRYKALQYARASYRSAGRRPPKMAQQLIDAGAYLNYPDVIEWAQRACAKIITNEPKRRR